MGHLGLPTCAWQAVGSIWELGVSLMTLRVPRELGLSEIPGGGRVWCGRAAGPLLGFLPGPMRSPRGWANARGERWVPSDDLRPCQPLSPGPAYQQVVLKILFRKHRGNFSSPFPLPGIVDPMRELSPLLLVTKALVDVSAPFHCCPVVLRPSSWVSRLH